MMSSAADPLGFYDWLQPQSPSSYNTGSGSKPAPLGAYSWLDQAMQNSVVAPTGLYPWLDQRTQEVMADWSSWSTSFTGLGESVLQMIRDFLAQIWDGIQAVAQQFIDTLSGAGAGLIGGGVEMKVSQGFVRHLVFFEGLKLQPYNRLEKGSTHLFAIGIGHNIVPGRDDWMMKGITEAQAYQIKAQDLADCEAYVKPRLKVVPNQVEYDVLVGCMFALGNLGKNKIISLWNSGDRAALCKQIASNVGVGRTPDNPQGNLWERAGMYVDAIQNSGTFRWPATAADIELNKTRWRAMQRSAAGL